MTDRELIYNTLLSGIPYDIMGSVTCHDEETNMPVEVVGQIKGLRNNGYVEFYYPDGSFSLFRINDVKPYLRPMSSMTDKEDMHSCAFLDDIEGGVLGAIPNYIDWLSSNHLDYRGLIDKGLALPAKDGMY